MRIQNKLFIAFLLAGISLVSLMFVAIQWSLTQGLLDFINSKERDSVAPLVKVLGERYQIDNSWDFIDGRSRLFHELYRDYVESNNNPHFIPPAPAPRRNNYERGDRPRQRADESHQLPRRRYQDDLDEPPKRQNRKEPRHYLGGELPPHLRGGPSQRGHPIALSLYDQNKRHLAGRPEADSGDNWVPIEHNQKVIGFVVMPKRLDISQGYELSLLEQQRFAYIIISILLIALTAVIAMPLARNLVDPIKQLAQSMALLTKGDYQSRLNLKRNDELGVLSRDVNELAVTLEKNETMRKRWLADISHELRTPIAVMKGEMEAVIDGIRPLNIDQVESSYQEVQRLQRLVEDLYELSSADIGGMKYRKEQLDLVELLIDEIPHFKLILSKSNIMLYSQLPQEPLLMWGDPDRLCQLFKNILVNCTKYAHDNGEVNIAVKTVDNNIQITVADNGPGVADEHIASLFEHLYRVDDSRNRKTGGSGLGLAICKQIVEAHQGTIWAKKSSQGGLAVVIELPLV